MPEVSKIDPSDFRPARPVVKLDPADFEPANKNTPASTAPSAPQEPATLKSIGKKAGRGVADFATGYAPIAAGAYMGGEIGALGGPAAPFTIPIGAVIGAAAGGFAVPAAEYLMHRHLLGDKDEPAPTVSDAARVANIAGQLEAVGPIAAVVSEPIAETVLGIRGASGLVRQGIAKAEEAKAALANRQTDIQSSIEKRQTEATADYQAKATALAQKQAQARDQIAATRKVAAQKAVVEHADTIKEAEASASEARTKLRQNIASDVEKARPAAAEQVGNAQAQQMVGKTPQQFGKEAAQPYEQRAAALSRSSSAYFDAAAKFHEEVGAKFEPFIGKIKDNAVAPASVEALGGTVQKIEQTIEERGQRIESPDLKRVIEEIKGGTGGSDEEAANAAMEKIGISPKMAAKMTPEAKANYIKQAKAQGILKGGDAPDELTYGQLWGQRARANKVLASSKNPADRAAAREVVGSIDDAIPNIPPEIRSQYAFERKISRSTMGKVAGARNPQEVGEAIFGSKANPEPAEVPLQIIRFTKQYAPDQMDGIREAFADRYLGNKMDANDLGKMNPQVLTELYGNGADGVIRLLGPEGEVKQASWGNLIKTDPNARGLLESAIRESSTKQANLAMREAIAEGNKAIAELPPKYDYVKQALANAKTPEAQLKILREQMPDPKTIEPTKSEAKVLAQNPPDVANAGKKALQKGAMGLEGRMEGYMKRRLAFMGMLAATGAYGMYAHRPQLVVASLILGGGLGVRGAARYALTTEGGANLYMKALDMKPTVENASAFGQAVAPMLSAAVAQQVRSAATEGLPQTPPK